MLAILAALGAWTIVIPYLGPAVGLKLHVAASVEVVDHVVPGAAILLVTVPTLVLERRGRVLPGDTIAVAAAALTFLAGFWVTSTHVPLIAEAARGESPWGAAIWHNSAGLPVAAISLWLLAGPLFGREPVQREAGAVRRSRGSATNSE